MKLHKRLLPFLLLLVAASITLHSCEDYNDITFESNSGDADFTTVVAVGNSLTAGYQSSALYQTAQRYSFPSQVAGQISSVQNFEQPLISDPGIGGRIGLGPASSPGEPVGPNPTEQQGQPLNSNLDRPYNNLGIPGAVLADFLGQDDGYSARRQANPFFDIVLRDLSSTQAEQMAALNPTFVMFWLGNNDILGYVTSGGTQDFVPPQSFQQLYQASMQQIAQTEADAVLFNIPDVASIPYVFFLRSQLEQQGAITLDDTGTYRLVTESDQAPNLPIYIETEAGPRPMRQNDFILLPASSYFAQVQAREVPPPVTPADAVPNNLVLDGPVTSPPTGTSELAQARGVVQQYNNTIASAAESNGFALVDINAAFTQIIADGGIEIGGQTMRPVPGELFSFDGIHPSNQGNGIVANATIDVLNSTYNANLKTIDLSAIPQGVPVNN